MNKSEQQSEVKSRLFRLIKFHNSSFSETELDSLISKGSIDYFYSATNKTAKTLTEENDAETMDSLFNQLRNN